MKHIYVNLKRFDVPVEYGGVNRIAPAGEWAAHIVSKTQETLKKYDPNDTEFAMFFPEMHLLQALRAKTEKSPLQIGCQGVYRQDTEPGKNFGAFTSNRPAAAMKAAGCDSCIIGHCEERNDKNEILAEAGITDPDTVNRILNREIRCAQNRGMKVLYCIGEKSEEQDRWEEVLGHQLCIGLEGKQCGDRLRAGLVDRTRENACGQGIYHKDCPLCQRCDRRNGCGLRRRTQTG